MCASDGQSEPSARLAASNCRVRPGILGRILVDRVEQALLHQVQVQVGGVTGRGAGPRVGLRGRLHRNADRGRRGRRRQRIGDEQALHRGDVDGLAGPDRGPAQPRRRVMAGLPDPIRRKSGHVDHAHAGHPVEHLGQCRPIGYQQDNLERDGAHRLLDADQRRDHGQGFAVTPHEERHRRPGGDLALQFRDVVLLERVPVDRCFR